MVSLGDYLFVESSFPRTKGERAELVTRVMPPRYQCMKFWYHMTGARMGRLDVFLEETKKEGKLTWSVSGDRGEHGWHKGVIPLEVVDTTFRVGGVVVVNRRLSRCCVCIILAGSSRAPLKVNNDG